MSNEHYRIEGEHQARLERYGQLTYSANELMDLQPPRWLEFEDWLPAEQLTLLYGKEGNYKTFIALGVSMELALRGHPVLYLGGESAHGFVARTFAWRELQEPTNLEPWVLTPVNFAMYDYRAREAWMRAMEGEFDRRGIEQPDLVVIDTLAKNFVGGDENSARDMGMLIDGAEAIMAEWNTAVMLVHHKGRESQHERGSTALKAAVFASWHVYGSWPSSEGVTTSLACDKMRDAPEPGPIKVRLTRVKDTFVGYDKGKPLITDSSLAWPHPFDEREPAAPPQTKQEDDQVLPMPAKRASVEPTDSEVIELASKGVITAANLSTPSTQANSQLNRLWRAGKLKHVKTNGKRRAYRAT